MAFAGDSNAELNPRIPSMIILLLLVVLFPIVGGLAIVGRPRQSSERPAPRTTAVAAPNLQASVTEASSARAANAPVIAASTTAAQPNNGNGKLLYAAQCMFCHGETGDGKGPAERFLYPKPRNFRDGKFILISTENRRPLDDDLLGAITHGMPGSAMFPFGHLADADRKELVAYVRVLIYAGMKERLRKAAEEAGEEPDADQIAKDAEELVQPGRRVTVPTGLPAASAESIARGKAKYLKICASCHGETGRGDGVQMQFNDEGMPIRPRDFTRGIFKGGREVDDLYRRIAIGMPGTPMPGAHSSITPDDIGDMIHFVRSLSDESSQAAVQHRRKLLVARRAESRFGTVVSEGAWDAATSASVVVSPLWWREYPEPRLRVQALHDGAEVALRLSWNDATRNDASFRPQDFEDMAAAQWFKGENEPFIGMGGADAMTDLWLWRSSWGSAAADAAATFDYYPEAGFGGPAAKAAGPFPDFLTARAAGNLNAKDPTRLFTGSNLVGKGFGTLTMRPKASQVVSAVARWETGTWVVVLRRPLRVGPDDGLSFALGERLSIAFALFDGEARDRDGQKLISIWHDLKLE